MNDNVSSLRVSEPDLAKLVPPSHVEPDHSQPGPDDRLAYLNKWDPPTESEWRRASWIVARELIRGIAGASWDVFAKLEVLATRKWPYGR